MKRSTLPLLAVLLCLGLFAANAWADSPSLQDYRIYLNGNPLSTGVNLSAFNTTTGIGTITITNTNPNPNTQFSIFIDEQLSTPFYNEYGIAVGSPVSGSGVSWEIGDSWYSTIFDDAAAGNLTNSNQLPIGASCYLQPCGAGFNGDAAIAFGLLYSLTPGYKEIIKITASQTTKPTGFYLDQTHPGDNNNDPGTDIYYSMTAEQVPIGGGEVPEPGTFVLLLSGLGAAAAKLRRRFPGRKALAGVGLVLIALFAASSANAQTVKTVPWDPTNPAAPHTAYPGASIVMGATFDPGTLSGDSFTYRWSFGDGSPATSATTIANFNDISATHVYAGATIGQTWTAVVTVTDVITNKQYTGNYLVIWENNTLKSRVNVAIDKGLWYLHQNMYHPGAGLGNWTSGCASGYPSYACGNGQGSLDATNVQAFEVNGHLATGPASDPYTSDVKQGLDHMFTNIYLTTAQPKTYNYNTALANYRCPDGSAGTQNKPPNQACGAQQPVYFNPAGTDCSAGCTITFDGNGNHNTAYMSDWGYENGMVMDAIVASGNPGGIVSGGAANGWTYKDLVQDMADRAEYCQYEYDYDHAVGYTRGYYPYSGGGWWYSCKQGNDNSVSQWAAIGLIGAQRGFGIPIPKIVTDANNMWVTASQDVGDSNRGSLGYNGSSQYSIPWGPFATTPSGMVQMTMDGIGRTKNAAFGDATTDPDQRWNDAETFYADNFCNNPASGSTTASPRAYTYGLFSFTKAMLLHNPKGALTPIQYLRTHTPGVFTTNNSIPPNTIDWYAALTPANGGSDPCDGVAQTIISRQNPQGYWYGDNVSGSQYPYETAWSLIMLQRTVFVTCVNNLGGRGTASGTAPARVDLTWTGIPNVTGYDVLRSATSGGPYSKVGSTTTTAYSDRVGLSNNSTYYYVLQPLNASGAVCQSNQATITVPKAR